MLFSQGHHLLLTILFGILAHIGDPVFFGHYGIHEVNQPVYLRMVITVQVNAFFLYAALYRNEILIAARRHNAVIMVKGLKRIRSQYADSIRYGFSNVCRIQGDVLFIEQVSAADPQVIVRKTIAHRSPINKFRMIVKTKSQHKMGAIFFLRLRMA